MTTPSADLLAQVYPGVPIRGAVEGHRTLLSVERARAELGYEPAYSWRDHVDVVFACQRSMWCACVAR
jgi:nucleoside-diphosphate-sugar epimerase